MKNYDEFIEFMLYSENKKFNKVYNEYKTRFPLLIKYLDVNDRLSIQVHPDNEIALKNHN